MRIINRIFYIIAAVAFAMMPLIFNACSSEDDPLSGDGPLIKIIDGNTFETVDQDITNGGEHYYNYKTYLSFFANDDKSGTFLYKRIWSTIDVDSGTDAGTIESAGFFRIEDDLLILESVEFNMKLMREDKYLVSDNGYYTFSYCKKATEQEREKSIIENNFIGTWKDSDDPNGFIDSYSFYSDNTGLWQRKYKYESYGKMSFKYVYNNKKAVITYDIDVSGQVAELQNNYLKIGAKYYSK